MANQTKVSQTELRKFNISPNMYEALGPGIENIANNMLAFQRKPYLYNIIWANVFIYFFLLLKCTKLKCIIKLITPYKI